MNQIQEEILKIYSQIMKICKAHNLVYYAIGGTCIGAVRHNGFIPWDDDMDIAMPFLDYKRFIDIAKKELPYPFELYLPEDHPHWVNNFIKVHNVETTFCERDSKYYPDRMTGINIDIMPIFGTPKSKIKRMVLSIKNEYYHYMNRRLRVPLTGRIRLLNPILKIFFLHKKDNMYYINRIDQIFSKYQIFQSDKVFFGWRDIITNRRGGFSYLLFADANDFQAVTEVPFENESISIPVGYDHYLTKEFGDYMTLPPKEKQKSHSPYLVNTKCSFKNISKKLN